MGKTLTLKLQLAKANSELAAQHQTLSRMQAQIDHLLYLQNLAVSPSNAQHSSNLSQVEGLPGP